MKERMQKEAKEIKHIKVEVASFHWVQGKVVTGNHGFFHEIYRGGFRLIFFPETIPLIKRLLHGF